MIHIVFFGGIAVALVTVGVTLWLVVAQRSTSRGQRRFVVNETTGVGETIMTSDD
jgi:hypothetical protein